MPTCRQFICRDQAFEGVLIGRPDEGVAALAIDLYGHDDAEHKLFNDGAHS
jgi:hypothetical protein